MTIAVRGKRKMLEKRPTMPGWCGGCTCTPPPTQAEEEKEA